MKKPYDINLHSFLLLSDEPFWTALSRSVTKIANRGIPTAGVCVNPRTCYYELHYNPDFFENLGQTDEDGNIITDPNKIHSRKNLEIAGVLEHEFYHLFFDHVVGRLPADSIKNTFLTKLWNFATDLAINSEIYKKLPYSALVPGRSYKDPLTGKIDDSFLNYPPGLCAEEYYEMLKKDPSIQELMKNDFSEDTDNTSNGDSKDSFGGRNILDDHSMWCGDEIDSVAKQIASERLKDALKEAANEVISGGRSWGSISVKIQKEILKNLSPSLINWRVVLRYFIKSSQKADKINSIKKINKRWPYIHPGRKSNRVANIAISIDQSGSVSDQMLILFFAEIDKLSKFASFTIIPFDDRVFEEKIYRWKKGEHKNWERCLSGGTDFNSPTEYVNNKNFDAHLICTDMCAPKPINSKCQRVWLTTQSCASNPYFKTSEKIVIIPDKDLCGFKTKK